MNNYKCTIERVVDGDTVDVFLDLGFSIWIKERIRVYGIDTPETRTKDKAEKEAGLKAKKRVTELLPKGSNQVCTTYKHKGKYGRYLADFVIKHTTLSQILLKENLAQEYYGKHKHKPK